MQYLKRLGVERGDVFAPSPLTSHPAACLDLRSYWGVVGYQSGSGWVLEGTDGLTRHSVADKTSLQTSSCPRGTYPTTGGFHRCLFCKHGLTRPRIEDGDIPIRGPLYPSSVQPHTFPVSTRPLTRVNPQVTLRSDLFKVRGDADTRDSREPVSSPYTHHPTPLGTSPSRPSGHTSRTLAVSLVEAPLFPSRLRPDLPRRPRRVSVGNSRPKQESE